MFDPMELAAWIFAIAMVVFIIVQFVAYVRANPIQRESMVSKGGKRRATRRAKRRSMSK